MTPAAEEKLGLYPWYIVGVLWLTSAMSVIDRQILGVLVDPIKADLGFTDGQFGALTGLAFGVVYALAAVPLARLADRWSRPGVISISLAFWSTATALSGAVTNFIQMFLARVGIGMGEAGALPATHALVSDYFPLRRRATVLAIISTGHALGTAAGVALGGWLYGLVGWRGAMVAVAAPGFVVALLIALTVRERRRPAGGGQVAGVSFGATVRTLVKTPSFVNIALGAMAIAFAVAGVMQWVSPFLMRGHGMSIEQIGAALGGVLAIAGLAGVLSGGLFGDQLLRREPRAYPLLMAVAATLAVPAFVGLVLSQSALWALAAVFVLVILTSATLAPAYAAIQTLAPVPMRATASACVGLVVSLGGGAVGPFAVGLASDAFARAGIEQSLRYALSLPALGAALAVWAFLRAARTMREDTAAASAAAADTPQAKTGEASAPI